MTKSKKNQEACPEVYELRLTPAPLPNDPDAHRPAGHLRVLVRGDATLGHVKNELHRLYPMPNSALLAGRGPERFGVHADLSTLGLQVGDAFEVHRGVAWQAVVTDVRRVEAHPVWVGTYEFSWPALAAALDACGEHTQGPVGDPAAGVGPVDRCRVELVYAAHAPGEPGLRWFHTGRLAEGCPSLQELVEAIVSSSDGLVAPGTTLWTKGHPGWARDKGFVSLEEVSCLRVVDVADPCEDSADPAARPPALYHLPLYFGGGDSDGPSGMVDVLVYDLRYWQSGFSRLYEFEVTTGDLQTDPTARERVGRLLLRAHGGNPLELVVDRLYIEVAAQRLEPDSVWVDGRRRGFDGQREAELDSLGLGVGGELRVDGLPPWVLTVRAVLDGVGSPLNYLTIDRSGFDRELLEHVLDAEEEAEFGPDGDETGGAEPRYRVTYTYRFGDTAFGKYDVRRGCPELGELYAFVHGLSGGLVPPDCGRFVADGGQGPLEFHVRDWERWPRGPVSEIGIAPGPYLLGEERLGDIWTLTFLVESEDGLEHGRVTVDVYNDALRWEERARRGRP